MCYSYLMFPSSSSSSIIIHILAITFSLLIPIAFPILDHELHEFPPPFNDLEPPPPFEYLEPPDRLPLHSTEDAELDYKCLPSNKSFTSNYNQSLTLVLNDLISNTSSLDKFRNASYHWPLQGPGESAYGLALCRRDVSSDECNACVNNSAISVIDHCPDSRAAIVWRNYCLLKYRDVDFFGTIDTDNKFTAENGDDWDNNNCTKSVVIFKRKLYHNATESPKFYGQMRANMKCIYETVYGVAQCTRDLSKDDCKKCLYVAVTNTTAYQKGVTIAYGSCNFRYEAYNFLKNNDF